MRSTGTERVDGDLYVTAFVTFGTLGWLGVALGAIYASIAGRRDVVVLLPVVWFLALVSAAALVAALVGPAPVSQLRRRDEARNLPKIRNGDQVRH